jgi:hypothetical protein
MPEDNQTPPAPEPPKTSSLPVEEPQPPAPETKPTAPLLSSRLARFRRWYADRKRISIPLTVLAVVLLVLAVPLTRYKSLGLVVKKDVTINVIDAETDSRVSAAYVLLAGHKVETDGQGKAHFKNVPVGSHTIQILKKYYKDGRAKISVGLTGSKRTYDIKVDATGRPLEVKVTNKITGKALANVQIVAGDIKAKTNNEGIATLVVPPGTAKLEVELSLDGYNTTKAEAVVTKDNKPSATVLSPAGKIYFLSKLSGKIDVVKSNLDGTERQTVLAGTGKEESRGTVLLASRDWKYLALLAKRDNNKPKLYLIETATDKVTTLDEGNASFEMVGWSDNYFIYKLTRDNYADWQSKKYVIKNYNAQTKQLAILEQSQALGSNSNSYAHEVFDDVYALGDTVVYTKTWVDYGYGNLAGKVSGQ